MKTNQSTEQHTIAEIKKALIERPDIFELMQSVINAHLTPEQLAYYAGLLKSYSQQ